MIKDRSIADSFTKLILVLLIAFFLFVVGTTTIMELFRIQKYVHLELSTQALNRLEAIEQTLENHREAIIRTAQSQLSINSLIDTEGSDFYFEHALEDLTRSNSINGAQVFDYAGNIFKSPSTPTWYYPSLVSEALVTGKGYIKLENNAFYIVEPIVYFGAVQGGIIAYVTLPALVTPTFENVTQNYSLTFERKWTFENKSRDTMGLTAFVTPPSDMMLSKYDVSLMLSESYFYLLSAIAPWLTSFSILTLISLFPMAVIARQLGRRMAAPIAHLSEKVNTGSYPIELTQTTTELTVLANAFNHATEQIRHGNELTVEAERQSGQSQLAAIVETVIDCIITIDDSGHIATFNPAAEGLFGYYAEEVIGKNVKLLMPEALASQHDTYLANYLGGKPAKIIGSGREIVAMRKDGSTFPAELSVSQMNVLGKRMFTGIIRDITARKQEQDMKNEFVATVSHELRTPLTSIRGSLGLVLGKFGDDIPTKGKKMLTIALRNSERLTLLINDILDIEKLESGQMTFQFSRNNLNAIIRRSVDDMDGYAKQHHVSLVYINEIQDAYINVDSSRLQQVIANLLSNAIKYSPAYSQVTITLLRVDTEFRVEVTDVGSGIPAEFHNDIFERFSQADSSATRRVGGTGLGLSITRAIINGHKGSIDFFSVLGEGSTFFFTLPIDASEAKRLAAFDNRVSHSDYAIPQLLYVGDNQALKLTLRDAFKNDIEISCSPSLKSAEIAIEHQRFELIICDVANGEARYMPFFNTLSNLAIPVIVLSKVASHTAMPSNILSRHTVSDLNIDKLKSEVRLILKKNFPQKAM
ncbi:PAS domain S-box protein [Enterovibrio calviensis]|uniref:PAS domain S-box protein n=1 Tax=Enterovibrio calviensis TaxID=91359 RepID=UPI0004872DCD|nr:PAS domain S-box protein [Enterovibrio calviensis]